MRSDRLSVSIAHPFILGHSPDPDDAFMFYAIAQNKIDLRGYQFEHRLEDIQTLNERARRGELHISAISIHAYAYVTDKYALLPCGASMGDGYGPLVIRKRRIADAADRLVRSALPDAPSSTAQRAEDCPPYPTPLIDDRVRQTLRGCTIAVPGKLTSAFLALQLFLGEFEFIVVPFDRIFDAVENGSADAGLIIHEGQLTYMRSGFEKIVDLGEWWKGQTGLPLPLGGNVVRKDIPPLVRRDLSEIIRESIDYGLTHRDEAVAYSFAYARDMNAQLASKFIGMYVNEFTRDYGQIGRAAIGRFLSDAHRKGYINAPVELEFVE